MRRRVFLSGLFLTGVGLPVLAGCEFGGRRVRWLHLSIRVANMSSAANLRRQVTSGLAGSSTPTSWVTT